MAIRDRNGNRIPVYQMTGVQLRQALESELNSIGFAERMIESARAEIALIRARMSQPVKAIDGGGRTTPRKKICRIHVWDKETNRRIRNHKYDHRHPLYKGKDL